MQRHNLKAQLNRKTNKANADMGAYNMRLDPGARPEIEKERPERKLRETHCLTQHSHTVRTWPGASLGPTLYDIALINATICLAKTPIQQHMRIDAI